jgi:hypothetical protein
MGAGRIRSAWALARLLPAYASFALMKHVVPLETLARRAWREPDDRRDRAAEAHATSRVVRLAHLLRAADRDCLHRSLLLYRELSGAGADPALVLGFRREGAALRGHAWIVVDGRPIAESAESLAAFAPAMTFGAHGVRTSAPDAPAS